MMPLLSILPPMDRPLLPPSPLGKQKLKQKQEGQQEEQQEEEQQPAVGQQEKEGQQETKEEEKEDEEKKEEEQEEQQEKGKGGGEKAQQQDKTGKPEEKGGEDEKKEGGLQQGALCLEASSSAAVGQIDDAAIGDAAIDDAIDDAAIDDTHAADCSCSDCGYARLLSVVHAALPRLLQPMLVSAPPVSITSSRWCRLRKVTVAAITQRLLIVLRVEIAPLLEKPVYECEQASLARQRGKKDSGGSNGGAGLRVWLPRCHALLRCAFVPSLIHELLLAAGGDAQGRAVMRSSSNILLTTLQRALDTVLLLYADLITRLGWTQLQVDAAHGVDHGSTHTAPTAGANAPTAHTILEASPPIPPSLPSQPQPVLQGACSERCGGACAGRQLSSAVDLLGRQCIVGIVHVLPMLPPLSPEGRAHSIELWVSVDKVLRMGGTAGDAKDSDAKGTKDGVRGWVRGVVSGEVWHRWEKFAEKASLQSRMQSFPLWAHPNEPASERTKQKKEGTGWALQF
jgi:hypothetical protein